MIKAHNIEKEELNFIPNGTRHGHIKVGYTR